MMLLDMLEGMDISGKAENAHFARAQRSMFKFSSAKSQGVPLLLPGSSC
jgi:hypothetical protein